ncbi:MAG: PKD domain-containing protein [Micropruina sp.]|uniref:PKD domain-containing protein n=1 Tax=Micropruina sp. TaxID=2737536 RepID=UPI0039E5D9B8
MRAIRIVAAAVSGALLSTMLSAAPSMAAAPDVAQLVSPADGSTATAAGLTLSVRPNDPDGGDLQVRFEGRKRGATVPVLGDADPFTLVTIPDVQNYTYNNRQGTMVQQAQWVLDTRSQLNTAMVVGLGDLVSEEDNLTQWGHTSTAMKVMDDAGMPNTVVAGNHDFHEDTGAFTEYDQFFPPSRYLNASWTPGTTRYGGYLGQNLFGPDPVDRRNMNNFALFSAGGRDWLVLNLEWEAPSYATDWAAKVLAAYPDRIAILVTHSFVGVNGLRRTTPERPGGTSANQLWTDFVSQQCQIKLVLNGHFHNGDAGEANRSDLNRCGEPVQQILSDYQSRANGGDGWLRYYTFDPVANTMTAHTYSPKLGTFETDADSQFTLPFALATTQPAPFETIGTATVPSGTVASRPWTGLDEDSRYEWRAVTSDGDDSTTSPVWEVRTAPSASVVDDTFTRNVTNGWGATTAGQAWQYTSGATAFSVDGAVGRIVAPAGSTRGVRLPTVSVADAVVQTDLAVSPVATGSGTYVSVLGRIADAGSYRAKIRYLAGGGVNLSLIRYTGSEVSLASTTISGLTISSGQYLRLKFELDGSSPTTLRAKLWRLDQSEPAAWTVSATDSTAGLQEAGSLGIDVYPSGSAAGPATATFDRFTVTRPDAQPPANQPPTAVIAAPSIDERTVAVSGTGSHDPDGTIAAYAWQFGDGATATGPSTTHTYASDGTFTITLTVTDDDGSTASATRSVTVAATPPETPIIASDTFARSFANGWGAAEVGGTWTGTGSRYSVSNGAGNHILSTPGTSAETGLAVNGTNVDLRASTAWSRTASAGTIYGTVLVRRQANGNDYRLKVVVSPSGAFQLVLARKVGSTETVLRSATLPGLVLAADARYRIAFQVTSSAGSTALSARLWPDGSAEPGTWAVTATDATAQLQAGGGIGFNSYLSSSATAPVTMRIADLMVTPLA